MEAATHAMAPKTSNMCDTHTVYEAAPAEMSVTKATIHTYGATHAMTETVTSKMGDIYAAVSETVTRDDAPISADAHVPSRHGCSQHRCRPSHLHRYWSAARQPYHHSGGPNATPVLCPSYTTQVFARRYGNQALVRVIF
jgi:hypothetical protein